MKWQEKFRSSDLVLILGLITITIQPITAVAQWKYDAHQIPLLPPYCKYTQLYRSVVPGANDPAAIERWSNVMGGNENFSHMHHYCWALESTNRGLYSSRTKLERDRHFAASLGDLDYVVRRVKADFVLLPEVLTKMGENLIRIGRGPEAVGVLTSAIALKPNYWPPYAALGEYYDQLGDKATARAWLEKGLAASPGTVALERRLQKLDGRNAR